MLKPDTIPHEEPLIRVGIVLPEDRFEQIQLELPAIEDFFIQTAKSPKQKIKSRELVIISKGDDIEVDGSQEGNFCIFSPLNTAEVRPGYGINLKNIVAGRGFHWQKFIDVFLPGSIEIRSHGSFLVVINELSVESYLMCVATSEMGAACPQALIEAQTIAARSWLLANIEQKHINLGIDVCNDDCCQRYQGSGNLTEHSMRGALHTKGLVLTYQQRICDARYSKSCGGVMERYSTIWDDQEHGYLQAIPDAATGFSHTALPLLTEKKLNEWLDDLPLCYCSSRSVPEKTLKKYLGNVDEDGRYFRWQFSYKHDKLRDLLNRRLNLDAKEIIHLEPIQRGPSGRLIKLKILFYTSNRDKKSFVLDKDLEIRRALHEGFLYSSCFQIEEKSDIDGHVYTFTLKGAGWGHGVGLCQIGALGMSLQGLASDTILKHYYPGSLIEKIY